MGTGSAGRERLLASRTARWTSTFLLSFSFLLLAAAPPVAETYPSRPVQIVVPYTAGGATDIIARALAFGLREPLGQSVVVVNRPGAGTLVGTQYVARAEPDGYTLLVASSPHTSNPILRKNLPYRIADFASISRISNTPNVLFVHAGLPIHSVADLVAYAKKYPGKLNYATFGVGSSSHLAALQFQALTGTELVHVPFKGGAPAALAVMSGDAQLMFGTPISVRPGLDGGTVRALAISSQKRLAMFPDLPTFTELGIDYQGGGWFGLLAPAGTPASVVARLEEATRKALTHPDMLREFQNSGAEVFGSSPAEFDRFIAEEIKRNETLLAGIDPQ